MRISLMVVSVLVANIGITGPALAQSGFLDALKDSLLKPQSAEGGADSITAIGNVLSNDDIIAGLREALRVGTESVTGQIGALDGFNADPAIHIPLPPAMQKVQSTLKQFGLSALADDLELRINRAAEQAAPKTKELIWKAINEMTLEDARRIYDGPENAATLYFQRVASEDLAAAIQPVVNQTLDEAGAVIAYDALVSQFDQIPFMPDIKGNLSDHAVAMTMQGLFHYLAIEEAAIRKDPAKRSTEILQQVFGL